MSTALVDPRIERSREQVLAATVDLLREVGYGPLTIEAVAARSGVAKSTIYRHWSSKGQMVSDAFVWSYERDPRFEPPPGPVRDRVAAVLQTIIRDMSSTDRLACVMPALIDAAERDEEIAALTRRMSEAKSATVRELLDEAVAAGELPDHIDTGVLADALLGPVLLRKLFHRPPMATEDVPAMVEQVLRGPAGP